MIGMKLINVIRKEHPELFDDELIEKITSEAKEALKYEMQIIEWIVNGYGAEKLNSPILKEFIKDRMNDSLKQIGFEEIFDVDKELLSKTMWFQEQVLGNNSSDFFHSRPVEYSKKSKSFAAEDLF
jgi:ribonucleoside-diphosphate reductase beta chain